MPVALSPGESTSLLVELLPEGTVPDGFVGVPAGLFLAGEAEGSLPGGGESGQAFSLPLLSGPAGGSGVLSRVGSRRPSVGGPTLTGIGL